jgi:class 3 adenylate cyclase
MGGSEGGPLCILFAATFPARTAALVLVAAYARRMWAPDYPFGVDQDTHQRILTAIQERWGQEPFGLKRLAPSLAGDQRFVEWYTAAQRYGASPGAALAWYRVTTEIDVRQVLPTIRVPTLVMHRTGDRMLPIEASRYLAANIPGARYVELPGADHFWFSGDADAVLNEVEEFLTGMRARIEPDRVLGTMLFTDIVGSTEHAAELGNARWADLVQSHFQLLRRELSRFRGNEIHTTGDGILATFDGPARAVRCGCAMRDAVRPLGLEIRVGLHTGEYELIGQEIAGVAIHIAARVMSKAGASEVWVSSTVKDLIAGSGIEFLDRGMHMLKGVPGEWHLYHVSSC